MPIKLKQSSKHYDRVTKKTTVQNHYMKNQSLDTLFSELNKDNTKPKLKAKIRNEIVRRGITIVKRPIENGTI